MGAFRTLLAFMVVIAHLSVPFFDRYGMYAVYGFYVISGYLMTRILHDVYQFDPSRFWANRILRLFPPYYIALGLTVIAVAMFPSEAHQYLPDNWRSITLGDLLIVPEAFHKSSSTIPVAWSLGVELVNYAILFAFTARTRLFAFITLGLSLCWHLFVWGMRAVGHSDYGVFDVYLPFYGALLPFAVGSLVYFYRDRLPRPGLIVLVPWALNVIASTWFHNALSFYLNLVLVTLVVVSLTGIRSKADRQIGDLAYPIFLCHYVVHFLVTVSLFGQARDGWTLIISMPFIVGVSYLLAKTSTWLIEPARDKIRGVAVAT